MFDSFPSSITVRRLVRSTALIPLIVIYEKQNKKKHRNTFQVQLCSDVFASFSEVFECTDGHEH